MNSRLFHTISYYFILFHTNQNTVPSYRGCQPVAFERQIQPVPDPKIKVVPFDDPRKK
jgi:hypothetical protein